jgi:hypothetical protein
LTAAACCTWPSARALAKPADARRRGGDVCADRAARTSMKHKVRNIHFVGIGGAGMSGIAEVLPTRVIEVSGSDLATTPPPAAWHKLGARVVRGPRRANIADADVVVVSTAVRPTTRRWSRRASATFRWCRARRCSPS